jgi:hypothetical protein
MKTSKQLLALLVSGAAALPLAAQAVEVHPVIVAGVDFGGDKIVTVQFTNGNSDSIRAGDGLYLGAGVSIRDDDNKIEFLGTLNYKYTSISADNGSVTWTRIPLDALAFYRWEKFRLGGGVTYHTSPKISGSGFASGSVTVDNALGEVVQGDFLVGPKFWIGLRYTHITYKNSNGSAKGDSAGLTIGYAF